jgi:hypothetical protein
MDQYCGIVPCEGTFIPVTNEIDFLDIASSQHSEVLWLPFVM